MAKRCFRFVVGCAVWTACLGHAGADDVRYYEENGVTYCETRRTVSCPVTEITQQPVDRTFYRRQQRTEYQTSTRVVSVPVTEYRSEAYWKNRHNPFVQPTLAERLVPYTRWESRTEQVQVPVVKDELVPEVRQEYVPVVTQRNVEQHLVSRVPVGQVPPAAAQGVPPATVAAQQPQVGGILRLDAVPPHQISNRGWRPVGGTVVR